MSDYGHWSVFEETDIKNNIGFVYVITFEDGKKYVGAKKIWKRIKAAPSTFKRGPKKGFEESDWKTYTSSSNELNSMLENGIKPKEYLIVGWYPTWGKTLMAEMEMQLANDVLRDPMWLNKQIGGHFNPNCFDDLTEEDIARWMNFDKGNEHVSWPMMYKIGQKTKYVKPDDVQKYLDSGWQFGRSKEEKLSVYHSVSKFKIWDELNSCEIEVINQAEFARKNDISSSHITNLLNGKLDIIKDRWTLHPSIRRQRWKFQHVETGKKFASNSEVEEFFGSNRGSCSKFVKSGEIIKLQIEDKKSYIERLSTLNLVETIKIEHTSKIMTNSFKEIKANLKSPEEILLTIEWLEDYVYYLKKGLK
ncbi:hypothetical protein CPTAKMNP4_070 [Salmonella phage vB_SenM-AKM_NP4]|uniref:Putative endonuclease SegE-like GIY-YIG domain-containing protein n=2 Tax=Gelderlandvirus TaxID=1913653 RepID=M1EAF6_BPS16|nr:homing endonuclease [Salmonella phage vB_SenM-S16]YP_009126276.1 homing endonuclease [Salmonella phage STP4-a]UFK27194.1 hypothetical protein LG358_00173 [Escherichia phage UoN_LG358_1]WDR21736.1 hypothetical protein PJM34_0068 [Salmonella phage vB_SenM_UTK0003]WKV23418.1 hypothetical protein SEA1_gp0070 [Salmonella phage SEA1]WLI71695.1 hypothetical protein CPTAKMNP4_070 [Salmonella phage vB_SenM-AKM_NP4]AEO97050.1 hypothetical protein [Salmonella phage vB_SenM-S16]